MAHGDQANVLVAAVEGGHVQAVLADLEVPAAVNDLPETQESSGAAWQGGRVCCDRRPCPRRGPGQTRPPPRLVPVRPPGALGPLPRAIAPAKRHRLKVFCSSVWVGVGFFSIREFSTDLRPIKVNEIFFSTDLSGFWTIS